MTRLVIISGAAVGIGRAMAREFALAGDQLALIDQSDAVHDLADELRRAGRNAASYQCDVSDWSGLDQTLADIAQQHGPASVAIANAGIARKVPLAEMDEAAWESVLSVNLNGTAQLLLGAACAMPSGGSLIAISSTSARLGWTDHVHYSASKAGIEGLVRGLAVELGPKGIRANTILPGVIRTAQSLSEEHSLGEVGLSNISSRLPLRRVGQPEDVAKVAQFLASDAAAYITGQSLIVDGGLTIASY
ncbi:SDR family NAD(P)-dependent oxidoreductase [Nitratireductor aquibiodomus]|uniref:SDR family NAD(P)-dependent oxidoreductase n=1 Tax=Nitratireductor aquibiodomus TaxID=204799 RepID=UPI000468FC46|nr:SDR family NAD(P)-dependent oxidoreductase [Nitratireductor aquibiodomus]